MITELGSNLYLGGSDDVRTKLFDLLPWAMFTLLPLLGLTIVLLMTLFLAKPVKGARPNVTPALAFGLLGLGMVMVGMIGTALFAIEDLGLQGTVFAEGALIYVVYGTVLAALGGMTYWAPKLWGVNLPATKVLPIAGRRTEFADCEDKENGSWKDDLCGQARIPTRCGPRSEHCDFATSYTLYTAGRIQVQWYI